MCTEIDLEVFKYSNVKENDYERDTDQDDNLYDDSFCKYLTDSRFQIFCKDTTGFSIIHFLLRSLNSNHDKIEYYLHELSFKFDVIVMTVTWANPLIDYDFDLERCDMFIERFTDTSSTFNNDNELYICGDLNIDLLKY